MHHLFLPPAQFSTDTVQILGEDHQHIAKVLRMRVGESLVVLDNAGNCFQATLQEIGKHVSCASLESRILLASEPRFPLIVAQAPGKGDRFEQVIQHGTEVGATVFQPLATERGVVTLSAEREVAKRERWRQIAKGAAEQSHRLRIPEVLPMLSFREWLPMQDPKATLALHTTPELPSLEERLAQFSEQPPSLAVAVGAEGGWSQLEVSEMERANIPLVSLGRRILRTETAALVALSQILYHFERR